MIEVSHITKDFISPKKYPGLKGAIKGVFSTEKVLKRAVDDISFKINDGEIVGYIGSNGAGKSTTIKMMTGILNPTKGDCTVNGVNPNKQRKINAKNIGVVFGQRTQLWWDLPLSESFTILKEIYDVSDEKYKNQLEFFNKVLGLNEFFDRPVRNLSLGQRMRADLGASLLHNPKVLYLDEPTIGLDLVVKDNIRKAIKEINKKYNTTIILTTHDIEDIEELCNRIIIIDHGKKIYDGSLKDLKTKYSVNKRVCFEIKDIENAKNIDLKDEFNLSKSDIYSEIDEEEKIYTINFNVKKLQSPQVISKIMQLIPVRDVHVYETELADIVKEIYCKGGVDE
ncbi:ATP-binding cassette domain-containing protein [Clostridium sp. BJN0001]|uniref:ABC transporter ATP-binding protein n=1 Tax=Clostridium sp. BJN0001 TaxID=2930219 RepID=UPI001FD2A20B|nr:ATP-binding cassette domain-containing protein [Clostridium sp. BJN0001]